MPMVFAIILNNVKPEYSSELSHIENLNGRESILVDANFDQSINNRELVLGKLEVFCPERLQEAS